MDVALAVRSLIDHKSDVVAELAVYVCETEMLFGHNKLAFTWPCPFSLQAAAMNQ